MVNNFTFSIKSKDAIIDGGNTRGFFLYFFGFKQPKKKKSNKIYKLNFSHCSNKLFKYNILIIQIILIITVNEQLRI